MAHARELNKVALQSAHGIIGSAACAWWDTLTPYEQSLIDPAEINAWCITLAGVDDVRTMSNRTIQALVCMNATKHGLIHPERLTVWVASMFGVTITDDAEHHEPKRTWR